MFFDYLIVDLVKCLHVHSFVMNFYYISFIVVLGKLTEKSSKLDSFITIFDEFKKDMSDIFFKYMKCKYYNKEISNFLFEQHPEIMLFS